MFVTLLLAATAAQVPVHVGRFEPTEFPNAVKVDRRMPQGEMNQRVERILAKKQCRIAGQHKEQFDLTVPYAVQIDSSGRATKIVVKDIGCAPIETLVGQVATELSKARDFKVQHQSGERWYVSDASFTRVNEDTARTMKDLDRVICREDRPVLGSRLAKAKQCRTVAEWIVFDKDRDQMRRDLQSEGKHGRN
jgi:hypothetical protein